jgi:hypothetical protein
MAAKTMPAHGALGARPRRVAHPLEHARQTLDHMHGRHCLTPTGPRALNEERLGPGPLWPIAGRRDQRAVSASVRIAGQRMRRRLSVEM